MVYIFGSKDLFTNENALWGKIPSEGYLIGYSLFKRNEYLTFGYHPSINWNRQFWPGLLSCQAFQTLNIGEKMKLSYQKNKSRNKWYSNGGNSSFISSCCHGNVVVAPWRQADILTSLETRKTREDALLLIDISCRWKRTLSAVSGRVQEPALRSWVSTGGKRSGWGWSGRRVQIQIFFLFDFLQLS